MAMYSLREERDMKPASFGKLVSSLLYEKRFGPYFIEPVIAGLDRSVQSLCCYTTVKTSSRMPLFCEGTGMV
jgi:20S proteasome subunit beta 3